MLDVGEYLKMNWVLFISTVWLKLIILAYMKLKSIARYAKSINKIFRRVMHPILSIKVSNVCLLKW